MTAHNRMRVSRIKLHSVFLTMGVNTIHTLFASLVILLNWLQYDSVVCDDRVSYDECAKLISARLRLPAVMFAVIYKNIF